MMLKGVDVADKEEEVDSTCTCISLNDLLLGTMIGEVAALKCGPSCMIFPE